MTPLVRIRLCSLTLCCIIESAIRQLSGLGICSICSFAHSLFCSFALRSFAKKYQSDHEWFTLVKRATMSQSLSSLFKKEQPWANHSHCSLQKIDRERITLVAILLMNQANRSQKNKQFSQKNAFFVFHCFSPFKNKSDGSDLLFFKSKSLFDSQKTSDSLKKPKSKYPHLAVVNKNYKHHSWVPD